MNPVGYVLTHDTQLLSVLGFDLRRTNSSAHSNHEAFLVATELALGPSGRRYVALLAVFAFVGETVASVAQEKRLAWNADESTEVHPSGGISTDSADLRDIRLTAVTWVIRPEVGRRLKRKRHLVVCLAVCMYPSLCVTSICPFAGIGASVSSYCSVSLYIF